MCVPGVWPRRTDREAAGLGPAPQGRCGTLLWGSAPRPTTPLRPSQRACQQITPPTSSRLRQGQTSSGRLWWVETQQGSESFCLGFSIASVFSWVYWGDLG